MRRRVSEWPTAITAALAVFLVSTALSRCYTSKSFLLPVISAIVVAFTLGWIGRRLDVPASLAPAVSFVGFIEYLTIAYFRDSAFLGFVPTPQVFRDAGRVVAQGARDINQLAAPVVPTRDLIFITVAGVFAVAVIVDLIALRLRRPVLAGLPLLALFVIPSSLSPTGAGWISFALSAAGYLALLTTEGRDRVHRWGRRLAAQRATADDGYRRPVARAARGIGAAAIGFALVVPGLTPNLQNGLLTGTGAETGSGVGSGRGGKSGSNARTTISPVVELRKILNQNGERELIRVRTTEPQYLRLAVLDEFTGEAWKPSSLNKPTLDAKRPIALPPGLDPAIPTHVVRSEIAISNRHYGRYLPVPYSPTRVAGLAGKGNWKYDDTSRTIQSSQKSISGLAYSVDSVVVTPDPLTLDDSLPYPTEIDPFTKLQAGKVDPSVSVLARSVTRRASTDWGRVVALQNYFSTTGGFQYSTTIRAGTGGDALKAFLRDKVGYCEQYAAAMAVMVRALGMPARVVVGFTAGTNKGDYYSITNRDAHAWPEVYFPTAGWVRFEPTPAGEGREAVAAPEEASIVPTAAPTPSASASASSSASASVNSARPFRPDDAERFYRPSTTDDFTPKSETSRRPLLVALIAFLLLLIPVVPAVTRTVARRRRRDNASTWRSRSHVAWQHVYDDAYDVRLGWPSSASPRVAGRSLISAARLDGPAAEAVTRLAAIEENARYAPPSHDEPSAVDFDADVATIRAALLAAVPSRQRLRALVFPASTLDALSAAAHLGSARTGKWAGGLVDAAVPARLRMRSS